jgi:hypothetical protein
MSVASDMWHGAGRVGATRSIRGPWTANGAKHAGRYQGVGATARSSRCTTSLTSTRSAA